MGHPVCTYYPLYFIRFCYFFIIPSYLQSKISVHPIGKMFDIKLNNKQNMFHQKKFDQTNIHTLLYYRLWIVTSETNRFPSAELKQCLKLTSEQPFTLRDSIIISFTKGQMSCFHSIFL